MAKRAKLMLIDGNALFYRAYHAIQHLTNKDGIPTNAVYGFAQMMLKAFSDLKPDYAILCWDSKTSAAPRLAIYSEYKAKRAKMADDFYSQVPLVAELAKAFGLPLLELDGFEADDIIGTLADQAHAQGLETIIVTNDRDTFQLLDKDVEIYMQRRGMTDTETMDEAGVQAKYGIRPHQIIDYKALAGDASDNIPGVAGVGEKTAVSLLQQYGTLDGIYEHIDEIQGKLRERLETDRANAYMSQKLATIIRDIPIKLDLEAARTGRYDKQAIHELFRRLDFKSLLTKLPPEMDSTPNLFSAQEPTKQRTHLEEADYICVRTEADLTELVNKLKQQNIFAFDTETDSLDVITTNLAGLAFSFKQGEAYYVPVGHKDGEQLPVEVVISALKPILEDSAVGKVGHNLKFDYEVMRRYDVTLAPIAFDTMVTAFLINPLARSQTLSDLAYSEFGIEMIGIEELIGKRGLDQGSFDMVTVEDATRYAAEDADISWRLFESLSKQLAAVGLQGLAEKMEWPLIPVLAEMELAGIQLDTDFLKKFNKDISARILKLEEEIWAAAGEKFNIGSPAQLGNVLFGKLGLTAPGVRRGKTGLSTAARELEKMRGQHPVVELVFEYRELVKLKSTYVDALPKMVAADGRVHTNYSQTIAQTGRLSSNNPNLQNIPIRTDLGREIRKAFVAPKGRIFVSADYSQIELRVAAALAKDQGMIKAFKDGIDIHASTAAEMFGVELDQVTKEQRYAAKTINFGVLYGMSPHGLSQAAGLSREDAADFIKRYFGVRPQLAAYIEQVKHQAREQEYTETLFGRRRPCPEINSNNHIIASAAERYAVNVPIQGTAADLMKLAMVALKSRLGASDKMLLQIHDELVIETELGSETAVAEMMKTTMADVYDIGVPIEVDTSFGASWGALD